MLTGEIRNQVDSVWNAFWSGGIANPLEVIEQITYLLFIKRLDEQHTADLAREEHTGKKPERRIFPKGKTDKGVKYDDLRWTRLKDMEPRLMFERMADHMFPFLRTLGGDGSAYAQHMKDARFTIPTPALLARVVDMLDGIDMSRRDTKGDLYEYMLGKIASAGQNGQFRTPRHIIELMVALTAPKPDDTITDPAMGTAGFLVAAGEYLRREHPEILRNKKSLEHFHEGTFHGFDFDRTMLRIGSMNLLLHGIEQPDVRYRDSLAQDHAEDAGHYSLILANPPFAGSLDHGSVAKDLQAIVKTKKTELLFLALFLRLLKNGGRAAVIVPDGVLFGSSKAHKELRRMLVEQHKLDAVISLPSGVFRPYAGVSTAILLFTKTRVGGTDHVWFYDMQADGWSLDDKRNPLLAEDKLGVAPAASTAHAASTAPAAPAASVRHSRKSGNPTTSPLALTPEEHGKNNLPDVLARWAQRDGKERKRARTAQSFCVPKADIAATGYDLSLNRYKEVVHEVIEHEAPRVILQRLAGIEREIAEGMKELEGILK